MIDICGEVARHVGELFTCAQVGANTRIRSPFMFPDGDYIDIYVHQREDGSFRVTDFGETGRWLRMQSVAPRRSSKQLSLIQDACITHGVEWYRGMIVARAENLHEVPVAVLRVGQASLRISDLWFTFRQQGGESIIQDVAEFLTENHIEFAPGEQHVGRSGKPWRVDFHTFGRTRSNLVEVLSTGSRGPAQAMVKHVVTVWHDLSHLRAQRNPLGFVTLFDDTADMWTEQDVALISDLSDVAYWSRPEAFAERLAA